VYWKPANSSVYRGFVVVQLEPPFAPDWGLEPDGLVNDFARVGRDIPKMWLDENLYQRRGVFAFETAEARERHRFAIRTLPDWREGRILEFIVDADTNEYWLERDWVDAEQHNDVT
jgi:hypothetical protein